MANVNAFIEYWDLRTQFREPFSKSAFKHGPLNSINIHGSPSHDSSVVLTKNEPSFYESIESGVKQLVTLFIEKMNWITYSSCEGHPSYQGVSYKKRNIQLLPRNVHEEKYIYQILDVASELTNTAIKKQFENPLSVKVHKEFLRSGETSYAALKLVFENNHCREMTYFSMLQQTYTDFIQYFNEVTFP